MFVKSDPVIKFLFEKAQIIWTFPCVSAQIKKQQLICILPEPRCSSRSSRCWVKHLYSWGGLSAFQSRLCPLLLELFLGGQSLWCVEQTCCRTGSWRCCLSVNDVFYAWLSVISFPLFELPLDLSMAIFTLTCCKPWTEIGMLEYMRKSHLGC